MAGLLFFANNRLTKFRKSPTSTYDDYTFYTYDHRNRLTVISYYDNAVKDPAELLYEIQNTYDFLNRRTVRYVVGDSSNYAQDRYAYDGLDIILEQHGNDSGGLSYTLFVNLWVPDGENSLLIAQQYNSGYVTPSDTRWMFSDAQQSTTDIVVSNNSAGTSFYRFNHISYDSAGNIASTFSAPGIGSGVHTRYTWQGMEWDIVVGAFLTVTDSLPSGSAWFQYCTSRLLIEV